ncbi:hypothetical protein ScPMuIL_006640 [Solemya velum]
MESEATAAIKAESGATDAIEVEPAATAAVKVEAVNGEKEEMESESAGKTVAETTENPKDVSKDDEDDIRPPIDPHELENHLDSKTCPICKTAYTAPKILYCLHSACLACIEKQADRFPANLPKPKITCPLRSCGEGLRVPRDVSFSLCDNTFLDSLVLERPADGIRCSVCRQRDQKVVATHRCADCSAKLCDTCAEGHTEGHQVKLYSNLIKMDKEKLEEQMAELEATGNSLDVKEEVDQRLATLDEQEAKDLAKINKEADRMIEKIEEQKKHTIEVLQDFYRRQRSKCGSKTASCDHMKSAIKSSIQITRRVMETGTTADYYSMKRAFEERIRALLKRKPRPSLNLTCPKVEALDADELFKESPLFKVTPPQSLDVETPSRANPRTKRNKSGGGDSDQGGPKFKKLKVRKIRQQQPYQRPMIGQVIAGPGPVALRPVQRIDAALPTDTMIPDLLGIAYTPDGGLAVVDRSNNCIKLFNPGGDFEESFSAFRPESIAVFENIVAWSNQQSLFFNAKGRGCVYKMDFETGGGRYPLTPFMDKYVLVANVFRRYLHMLNPEGMRIQQIDQRGIDGKVMGNIVYIAATKKGTYVMSDPDSRKITYTNNTGKPFAQFPPQDEYIKKFEPSGVCCDKRGNVFVSDHKGNRLFLLNPVGKEIQVWPLYGLVRRPTAMVCTPERHEGGYLFITGNDGFIDVLEYHYRR